MLTCSWATLVGPLVVLGVATVATSALKSLLHRARGNATSGNPWKPGASSHKCCLVSNASELSNVLMSGQCFPVAFV